MTKERLLEGMLDLPTKRSDAIARESETIEGDHGPVHYIMTRDRMVPLGNLVVFSLSCSGPLVEQLAFMEEMKAELGPPLHAGRSFYVRGGHFVLWNARAVEDRLKD